MGGAENQAAEIDRAMAEGDRREAPARPVADDSPADLMEMERRMAQAQRDVMLWDKKALLAHLRQFARLLEFVPDETGQVAKIRAQMLTAHADSVARM